MVTTACARLRKAGSSVRTDPQGGRASGPDVDLREHVPARWRAVSAHFVQTQMPRPWERWHPSSRSTVAIPSKVPTARRTAPDDAL